jgi:ferric-dicitrate binding protein FerR (iron transport regulator)
MELTFFDYSESGEQVELSEERFHQRNQEQFEQFRQQNPEQLEQFEQLCRQQ